MGLEVARMGRFLLSPSPPAESSCEMWSEGRGIDDSDAFDESMGALLCKHKVYDHAKSMCTCVVPLLKIMA
jgi:hypothetical protein